MTKDEVIRNCDKCGNEDSISSISGLCPTCEAKEKEREFKELEEENKVLRKKIDDNLKLYMTDINDEYQDIWSWINELVSNEIEQEKYCNQ